MVVARLAGRSFTIPEVCGLNPVSAENALLLIIETTKKEKKTLENGPIFQYRKSNTDRTQSKIKPTVCKGTERMK